MVHTPSLGHHHHWDHKEWWRWFQWAGPYLNETSELEHSQLTLTAEGCGIGVSDVHSLGTAHSHFTQIVIQIANSWSKSNIWLGGQSSTGYSSCGRTVSDVGHNSYITPTGNPKQTKTFLCVPLVTRMVRQQGVSSSREDTKKKNRIQSQRCSPHITTNAKDLHISVPCVDMVISPAPPQKEAYFKICSFSSNWGKPKVYN